MMNSNVTVNASGEALSLKLLQSVREMKAGQAARVTKVSPNEVLQARHKP